MLVQMFLKAKWKVKEMESCLLSCPNPKLMSREGNWIISQILVSVTGVNVITIVICQPKNNQIEIILSELNPTIKTIRTFGEKETYKFLGILEADTIKQVEMKEKIKSISREPEIYTRQNYAAEALSNKWIPGLYPSLDIRDHFWSGPEKNLSKWTQEE